jgi:RNA polymerase sigma-70 factor, ECF subfamily
VSVKAPTLSDPTTLANVYAEHAPSMRASATAVLADRFAAEDVGQDVFLWLWRHPDRYDAHRGALGTYLRLLTRCRAVDAWRSERSRGRGTDCPLEEAAASVAGDHDAPAAATERAGLAAAVRSAVRGLPSGQRDAVALAFWSDLTREEIAAVRRVPVGTAKSRVRLGLEHLRTDERIIGALAG